MKRQGWRVILERKRGREQLTGGLSYLRATADVHVWSQTNFISRDTHVNLTQFGWNMPGSDDTLWKLIKKNMESKVI